MPLALQVVRGANAGETLPLTEGESITAGRDKSNRLRLKDRKLSRIHAQFEARGNRCQVIDLNSTNGTSVNGAQIVEGVWTQPDDEIELGTTRLRLVELSPTEAPPERRPPTAEESSGLRCAECGRPITEEEVAAGKIRHVGDRFYCSRCIATFEDRTVDGAEPAAETDAPGAPLLARGTEMLGLRIIEPVGESRIARVYRAEQTAMGREVAFKLLAVADRDWSHKYLQAVYASGQLVHNNIALIFDTGEEKGRYYLVREFVEGESLEERLQRGQPYPIREAANIVTQATHALEHGAERHLFHGSLSPRKILVGSEANIVKVIGFGLPQKPPQGVAPAVYRRHALAYTPPERLDRITTPTFATDSYALIAVLYQMLTARAPFRGSSPESIKRRIRTKQPRPLSDYLREAPPTLRHLIDRGLSKDPGSRYQTADELLQDIETVVQREL
jgi:pSer/pThr/pTyr-binding forkhead associated (FHA) protein